MQQLLYTGTLFSGPTAKALAWKSNWAGHSKLRPLRKEACMASSPPKNAYS